MTILLNTTKKPVEKIKKIKRVFLATSDTELMGKLVGFINKDLETTSIHLDEKHTLTLQNFDITTPQFDGDALVLAIKTDNKEKTGTIKVYDRETEEKVEVKCTEVIDTLLALGMVEVENPKKFKLEDKFSAINSTKI